MLDQTSSSYYYVCSLSFVFSLFSFLFCLFFVSSASAFVGILFFVLPVYSLYFVFYIFVSYVSLPGDDDLSSLLATFLSISLRFVLLFPDSDCVPSLIWFGSVNLVTTATIVAYQSVREINNYYYSRPG